MVNETCEKIINYQLNKLETYPHLHDSIEFIYISHPIH